MSPELFSLLKPYLIPTVLIIVTMYFTLKSIKRDMSDIKEKVGVIADQQVEIARIHERLDHHAHRLEVLER